MNLSEREWSPFFVGRGEGVKSMLCGLSDPTVKNSMTMYTSHPYPHTDTAPYPEEEEEEEDFIDWELIASESEKIQYIHN